MKSMYEIDYIVHEFYSQTGKIVRDSVDNWIEAVRYIQRHRKPKRVRNSRASRKKTG